MKKVILGNTGYEVTEICFGCLPFGPLQKNLPVEEAAEVLSYGLDLGINFIDTAQMYMIILSLLWQKEKTSRLLLQNQRQLLMKIWRLQ